MARINKAEYQRRESYTGNEYRTSAEGSRKSLQSTDQIINVRIIPEPAGGETILYLVWLHEIVLQAGSGIILTLII